ncbi:MAG: peptidylprolyl isomerase [Chloroflexi bacterium]|nr:peptidylprolyl isomerase [Chloroflexota bacterium]
MANEPGKKSAATTKKHIARLQREQQQSRIVLYAFIGILTTVVLLLVYGYLDINYFQLKRPVAKVGETNILVNQFEPRVRMQRQQLLAQFGQYSQYAQIFGMDVSSQLQQIQTTLDSPVSIGQAVLDQLINEELIRQEAAKRGITASDEEIDTMMHDAFGYFPNGTPTSTTTPTEVVFPPVPAEAFKFVTKTPLPTATLAATATPEAATAEASPSPTVTLEPTEIATEIPEVTPFPTATPYTLEGFQSEFKTAQQGITKLGFKEDDYRRLFEIQILQEKLKAAIVADVPATVEQVWARHILVADEVTALAVIEKLKNGADFSELARTLSTDTGSGANGGDLGWFSAGAMVPEFETAAFALKNPGDYTTTPVQSQYGFHIIQLIAKQNRPLTADQYNSAKDKAFTDWLTAARDEYGVETFDIWKEHIPTEPNFSTLGTESAIQAQTRQAEADAQGAADATATP